MSKTNYEKLEKSAPKDWQEVKLGEVAEINPYENIAKNIKAKKVLMKSLIPYRKKIYHYDSGTYNGGSKFKNGDSLIASITPCLENGKTGFVDFLNEDEIGFGSTEFIVIREKKNITSEHFLYYLSTSPEFRETAIKSMTGTSGRQRVQTNEIINYNFSLPPLPEQKAIAEVLSSLDDKIDLLQKQNQTLENIAQTLFRKYFIQNKKKDWEIGKVSQLVKILSGGAFKSSSFVENGKYRLITIKNVQDGYLDLANTDYLEKIPEKIPKYCLLSKGDMLLSLTGNVGRCCLVTTDDLLLNQRVAKLEAKEKRDWVFTYIFFRQPLIQKMLKDMSKGTAQANLSLIETADIKIQIPPEKLLKLFSEIATPFLKKVLKNKTQIQTLEKLRNSLLPKLISGKIRVNF